MSFREEVWQLMKRIPRGKVTTYRILAETLGTKAYRAVGTACAKNPYAPIVPCHRVVNSNGFVGRFSAEGGIDKKIKMLSEEGIRISNRRIAHLEKYLHKF